MQNVLTTATLFGGSGAVYAWLRPALDVGAASGALLALLAIVGTVLAPGMRSARWAEQKRLWEAVTARATAGQSEADIEAEIGRLYQADPGTDVKALAEVAYNRAATELGCDPAAHCVITHWQRTVAFFA